MRVRVNPYGGSKSARELTKYLGAKRLLVTGSKFRGKSTDVVINWGMGKGNVGSARQINNLHNVQLASNKLRTLNTLRAHNVSTPQWDTDKRWMVPEKLYMARTTLYGHSGQGIVTGTLESLPQAPLYVEYIPKVAEYRAIVVRAPSNDDGVTHNVVDFKKKKKRSSPKDEDGNIIEEERMEYDEHIWNLDGGYIFARNDFTIPSGGKQLGVDAVVALGLDFGAVDIIEDEEGKLYVLEVNTAFGIEGTTLELVGNAIKELI